MNLMTTTPTMSSREIADLVEARHNDVVTTIERLFAKNLLRSSRKSRREATGGRPVDVYDLIERDTHLVVAGYSDEHRAKVIDRWQELEAKVSRPMTQAELIAASANHLVAIERRQAEQHAALASVEARTNQLEQIRYLDSVPSGFESITTIRDRINKRLGLPAWVINAVMREVTGAPLPFAMVRSKHAEDGGQPFAIWPKPAITRRFDRFIDECTLVTAERATHPEITGGRFKVKLERSL